MSTELEAPARMNAATLARYQHEERMAAANKPSREDRPSFGAKRSTASGSLGVMEIRADVPVCDEYPTSEEAFVAMVDFMDRAAAHWPLPDGYVRAVAKTDAEQIAGATRRGAIAARAKTK